MGRPLARGPPSVHDPATMSRPPPGLRADYAAFVPITTRWMDNDVFGHVNNVHYYSYFDTAVCSTLVRAGILTWRGGPHIVVIAESGCRFHKEVAFPDALTAGIRIARLGTSSIRWEIGIFREDEQSAAAEGFMVHVCADATTHRPAPLPDAWRQKLTNLGA